MRNFLGAAALSLSVASGCATTNEARKVETASSANAPEASAIPKPRRLRDIPERNVHLTRAELEACFGKLSEDPLPGQWNSGECGGLSRSAIAARLSVYPLVEAVEFLKQKDAENGNK